MRTRRGGRGRISVRSAFLTLVVATVELTVGCTTIDRPTQPSSPRSAIYYLETNRGVWLARDERDLVFCADGQELVCQRASGRLSARWCQCPEPVP